MNRKLIIPFILLMFYSCKNAPHEVILSQVQELYGRNIVFTHNDHYVLNGRDTIIKQTNDYKIVMYSDSLGCQECELKLGDWRLKIKELKLLGKAVDFIFIIQSSDYSSFEHMASENLPDFPFIYDKEGKFFKQNKLFSDKRYNTFLLDKDNRIILVGNPTNGDKIWELYKTQIPQKDE